jgi:hypothetical protein
MTLAGTLRWVASLSGKEIADELARRKAERDIIDVEYTMVPAKVTWQPSMLLRGLIAGIFSTGAAYAGNPQHPSYDHYDHHGKGDDHAPRRNAQTDNRSSADGRATAWGGAATATSGGATVSGIAGGAGGAGGQGGLGGSAVAGPSTSNSTASGGVIGDNAGSSAGIESRDRAYGLALTFAPVWSPGSPNHCTVHNAKSLGLLFGAFTHAKSGTLIDEVCQQLRTAELQDNLCRHKTAAAIRRVVFRRWGDPMLSQQGDADWQESRNLDFEHCTNAKLRYERSAVGLSLTPAQGVMADGMGATRQPTPSAQQMADSAVPLSKATTPRTSTLGATGEPAAIAPQAQASQPVAAKRGGTKFRCPGKRGGKRPKWVCYEVRDR